MPAITASRGSNTSCHSGFFIATQFVFGQELRLIVLHVRHQPVAAPLPLLCKFLGEFPAAVLSSKRLARRAVRSVGRRFELETCCCRSSKCTFERPDVSGDKSSVTSIGYEFRTKSAQS